MSEQLDRIRAAADTWQYRLLRAGLLFVLAIVVGGAAVGMLRTRLRPNWAEALTELAWLHLDLNDEKSAGAVIEMALKADPSHGPAHRARAQYLLRTEGDNTAFREARSRACRLGDEVACIMARSNR